MKNENVDTTEATKKPAIQSVTGIKAVLEQSLQSYDKLPMLEIIFEKFIRQLSTSLRNLTSEAVDVTVDSFSSLRFGNYFASLKSPLSIVVFKAVEWENLGLLILENNVIFSFVDLLLGGKKNTVSNSEIDDNRILTSIEQGIARQLSEVILTELSHAFDQITPTTFNFERLESNPNLVTISRPGDAVIVLKLKIEIDEQVKTVELLIPYKTIEPVKEQMQQVFLGDKFGSDQEWERLLTESIHDIDLPIEAVITNRLSTIEEIAKLKIGDTIVMEHAKDKDITVRTGPIALFTGKIGKVGNKVAINLKKLI
ncbi:MAG: FliM/FliN family flagellar motor switch protein [Rickettsiaceae bacterium]|nr:FliM/FliN family flagellar motor switch protein [Rickettsiaceae bacterium]MDP4832733.1 FliM/FliN family flagellar motor switch protein [Rickettsiaceae bacterium]MDP5020499.1 FliM/FliN family flagellar motor switch protein [Rickettsiaceae bacterium]MDP5083672.1 FliM/FliN family flagellar motor switch protein [Rickettsiaceae bacterium]